MNKLRLRGSKGVKERIQQKKRKTKKKGKIGIWLKIIDLGLFAGFASPIALHLGLLSLAWALTAIFLGLTLAALGAWGCLKTKETEEEKTKEREEGAWWS